MGVVVSNWNLLLGF